MTMTMPFKEIAKVGKGLLIQAVGIAENSKTVVESEEIDFNTCPSECIFKKFEPEHKMNVCMNHCPHNRQNKTTKTVYNNERHKYDLYKKTSYDKRLSKYQLLQLITYHYFVDSRGFGSLLSSKELAEYLGCTLRTFKNNNKRLQELGLVYYSECGSDLFSIKIVGYENNHLTAEQGGKGYVQMSKSFMEALVSMDNVNVMRLAIRSLLKFDSDVSVKQQDVCHYSYNDISLSMPSNINHKKIIDELMAKTSHIFTIFKSDHFISIHLKDEYNGKIQKVEKETFFKEQLEEHIETLNEDLAESEEITITQKDETDLIQLSMEYGLNYVIEALAVYLRYIQSQTTPDIVHNLGGFIRTVIRNGLSNRYGKIVA